MSLFLIACNDVWKRKGHDYKPLHDQLAAWGAVRQDFTWMVDLDMTPMQVGDALRPYIHSDDNLCALEVRSDAAARRAARKAGVRLKSRALTWSHISSLFERLRRA